MDSAREIRSCLLVLFPGPPLPIMAGRKDGREAIANSHDFLATIIDETAQRNDSAANAKRMMRHKDLINALMNDLQPCTSMQLMWPVLCRFTRDYLDAYFPGMMQDIRFVPFDHTPPVIMRQVWGWIAARQIVSGKASAKAEDHSYKNAMQTYWDTRELILADPTCVGLFE